MDSGCLLLESTAVDSVGFLANRAGPFLSSLVGLHLTRTCHAQICVAICSSSRSEGAAEEMAPRPFRGEAKEKDKGQPFRLRE